jgi:hypothetical protein
MAHVFWIAPELLKPERAIRPRKDVNTTINRGSRWTRQNAPGGIKSRRDWVNLPGSTIPADWGTLTYGLQGGVEVGSDLACRIVKEPLEVAAADVLASQDVTTFRDGSERRVAVIGPSWVGHGTYLPSWRWSEHVGATKGRPSEAHAGYVLSGQMVVADTNGAEIVVSAGEAFYAAPGHDAWVIGEQPCVALDFPLA